MCALVGICHVSLPGVPVPRVNNAEGSFRQGCNIVMYTVSAPYRKNQDDVIDVGGKEDGINLTPVSGSFGEEVMGGKLRRNDF